MSRANRKYLVAVLCALPMALVVVLLILWLLTNMCYGLSWKCYKDSLSVNHSATQIAELSVATRHEWGAV